MTMEVNVGGLLDAEGEEFAPRPTTGGQPQAPWSQMILSDDAVRVPLFDPSTWFVLLLPVAVKSELGSIALADTTQEAQRVFANFGEVLAIGPAVYSGTTNSGVDLSKLPKPQVGQLYAYPQHAGQRYYLRERFSNGVKAYQLLLKDSELIGKLRPEQAERIVVWV